jgi:hypothetical protein
MQSDERKGNAGAIASCTTVILDRMAKAWLEYWHQEVVAAHADGSSTPANSKGDCLDTRMRACSEHMKQHPIPDRQPGQEGTCKSTCFSIKSGCKCINDKL